MGWMFEGKTAQAKYDKWMAEIERIYGEEYAGRLHAQLLRDEARGINESIEGRASRVFNIVSLLRLGADPEEVLKRAHNCNEMNVFKDYRDTGFYDSMDSPVCYNKAKRKDNGDWICGGVEFVDRQWYINGVEVICDTICERCGKNDLHGMPLYEGDIVLFDDKDEAVIMSCEDRNGFKDFYIEFLHKEQERLGIASKWNVENFRREQFEWTERNIHD